MKGAVIGCGFFAQNQLEAWRDIAGIEIVALCDRDSERLNASATAFGIEHCYTDAAKMLDEAALISLTLRRPSDRTVLWSKWLRRPAFTLSAKNLSPKT